MERDCLSVEITSPEIINSVSKGPLPRSGSHLGQAHHSSHEPQWTYCQHQHHSLHCGAEEGSSNTIFDLWRMRCYQGEAHGNTQHMNGHYTACWPVWPWRLTSIFLLETCVSSKLQCLTHQPNKSLPPPPVNEITSHYSSSSSKKQHLEQQPDSSCEVSTATTASNTTMSFWGTLTGVWAYRPPCVCRCVSLYCVCVCACFVPFLSLCMCIIILLSNIMYIFRLPFHYTHTTKNLYHV